jgi:hypothetical protein
MREREIRGSRSGAIYDALRFVKEAFGMFELLVFAGLLAGVVVAFGGRDGARSDTAVITPVRRVPPVDLPCPWCGAETREDDAHCPSCHQPFG